MNQPILQPVVPRRHHHHHANVGAVDGLTFQFDQPNDTSYILAYDWPYGGSIAQLRITSDFGSGLCSVLINGNVVTGLDHVPVAALTRAEMSPSGNNQFLPGDDIYIRIDSGAPNLLNVRGTLVITNKAMFASQLLSPSPWFVENQISIDNTLAGGTIVPITFNPPLNRNPFHVFPATMSKNSPSESDVFFINYEPFEPNQDFTTGWNYIFSGALVLGQVMRYAYIP